MPATNSRWTGAPWIDVPGVANVCIHVRQVLPEAARLIGGFTWTYQKLPFHLKAKGEFEYVGRKVVGNGCDESNSSDLTSYSLGVPNQEFRLRSRGHFRGERSMSRVNMMIARGYTGQSTENFVTDYKPGSVGPLPVVDNPISELVGVRIPSYASVNFTYRFGR
jgi:hypothetical protein